MQPGSTGLAVCSLDDRLLEGDDFRLEEVVEELVRVLGNSPAGMINLKFSWKPHKGQSGVSLEQHPGGGLYTPRYLPYGFHMEWVDSTPHSMDSIWNLFG